MQVESLHPGVTREDVIANTGFELLFADDRWRSPPSRPAQELQILREEVDPPGGLSEKQLKYVT